MSRTRIAFASLLLVFAVGLAGTASAEPQPLWPAAPTSPGALMKSGTLQGVAYVSGDDATVRLHNMPTTVLSAKGEPSANSYGGESDTLSALPYRGKRIRVTGFLRSADAGGGAYWLRVDGPSGKQEMLDDMRDRALTGTHDWTPFTIVLDVPNDAEELVGGLALRGAGRVWAGDVTIDLAAPGTPTTGIAVAGEDTYVLGGSGGKAGYKTEKKTVWTNGVETAGSITLTATTPHALDRFGSYAHAISVAPYRGKRIRVTGFLRSTDASAAGYWVRVDGADGQVQAFDNMMTRPLVGTHDRTPFAIVLDVPTDALDIVGGVLLTGNGSVTAEDVRIEAVDATVPTTGTIPK